MARAPRSFIDDAAKILLNARHSPASAIDYIPRPLDPKTIEQGYEIADEVTKLGKYQVGGYKVGATNWRIMERYNIKEPFWGRAYVEDIITEGKRNTYVSPAKFLKPRVEAEISFRMGKDLLPKEGASYEKGEILQAVQGVLPSIEVIDTRFKKTVPIYSTIADNANFGCLVIGDTEVELSKVDIAALKVKLIVDKAVAGEGVSSDVLGNPAESLSWLVNALNARRIPIKRGQVICTGSITPPVPIRADDVVRAEFGELGSVQFLFKDKPREY